MSDDWADFSGFQAAPAVDNNTTTSSNNDSFNSFQKNEISSTDFEADFGDFGDFQAYVFVLNYI